MPVLDETLRNDIDHQAFVAQKCIKTRTAASRQPSIAPTQVPDESPQRPISALPPSPPSAWSGAKEYKSKPSACRQLGFS
jgi:hypothetical protein